MTFGNRLMESVETLKSNLRGLRKYEKPYSESVCNFNEDWYVKELSKLKSLIESVISDIERQKYNKRKERVGEQK